MRTNEEIRTHYNYRKQESHGDRVRALGVTIFNLGGAHMVAKGLGYEGRLPGGGKSAALFYRTDCFERCIAYAERLVAADKDNTMNL